MSSSDGAAKKPLTERELEILKHAWNCMKTPPEIDYPKLAEACGMTNPRSATNAWGVIKKKLFSDVPAPAANEDGTAATPAKRKRATPKKKVAPTPSPEEDENADELSAVVEKKLVVETPVKKRRTPAKKKAAPVAASQGDADAEDTVLPDTPAKKKRATPAKKRATPAKVKKEQEEAAAAAAAEEEEEDELTTTPQEEPKFEVKEEAKAKEDVEMEGDQNSAEI
ncbi:hypothetical protein CKAH01_15144 [Colletotrichum kahawae]|uniref:Uncharacterized protein n=1 Tax=Colletotrichum kahawae TaxID=34407 RepID=A0AAD9YKH6_COLKA|nr:hypothetical protein CKAH01_15144 [Colletotrichum kahawae]